MYADLEADNWPDPPVLHDLVGPVISGTEISGDGAYVALTPPEDYFIDDPEIERIAPILIHDADASQHSVLVDVMKGKNLVVQGPPGTGKSQTITNIIANALMQDKRVLFLAEKQAALTVVKRRLDRAALGEFCLELHSGKSSPKQVIESLKERHALGYAAPGRGPSPQTVDVTWEESRREIGKYLSSLHSPQSDGETAYSLIWRTLRNQTRTGRALDNFQSVTIPPHLLENPTDLERLRGDLAIYAELLDRYRSDFGSPTKSIWSSLELGGRAGSHVVAGLFEQLSKLGPAAKALEESGRKRVS